MDTNANAWQQEMRLKASLISSDPEAYYAKTRRKYLEESSVIVRVASKILSHGRSTA